MSASLCGLALLPGFCHPRAQDRGTKMIAPNTSRLLSIAGDPKSELKDRIRALTEMGQTGNREDAPQVRKLWDRKRPAQAPKPLDWDPDGAERVVDQYIILALHQLGDDSLLPEIGGLVAQAGRVLRGPDAELGNAAKVIRAVGQASLIHQLTELSASPKAPVAANAVRTLQLIKLPSPASGGPLDSFPGLARPVSFTIHRLREEVETIVTLSDGRIVLSDGVKDWIAKSDYERGEVQRKNTSLATVLTLEIDILDLTYAVTEQHVVICTFKEAGAHWQTWWMKFGHQLIWDPGKGEWHL